MKIGNGIDWVCKARRIGHLLVTGFIVSNRGPKPHYENIYTQKYEHESIVTCSVVKPRPEKNDFVNWIIIPNMFESYIYSKPPTKSTSTSH